MSASAAHAASTSVQLRAGHGDVTAEARGHVRSFIWAVDGSRIGQTPASARGRLHAARLSMHDLPSGNDRVTVSVSGRAHESASRVISVGESARRDTTSNAGGTGIPVRGIGTSPATAHRVGAWCSSFASGNFSSWSDWTQPLGGTFSVTTPGSAGIPAPPSGDRKIAHFQVTKAELRSGHVQSKLYEFWEVGHAHLNSETGQPLARMTNRGAGMYSAWYYLPRNYSIRYDGPVNIFQFKESYSSDGISYNDYGSDMQSSLNLFSRRTLKGYYGNDLALHHASGLRSTYPMLAVNLWHDPAVHPRPGHKYQAIPAPLGRWFNVTAKLYPGNRVSYYVDGKLLDTWHNDEYPVGVRSVMPNGELPQSWSFGVGHYGSNVGQLWVADGAYTPAH